MHIDINLNFQPNTARNKKTLRIFSVITLALAITTAVFLIYEIDESMVLLWFYMFYFLLISLSLFIQSKGKHILDYIGKSYLKMDDDSIEFKPEIMRKKATKIHWKNIEEVKVKLFEVHLKLKNGWEIINLEKLSDDNLKTVKQVFADIREKRIEEKNLVA